MQQFADYSGGRPSGAALKAAGFGGVIRYVGLGSAGKRLAAGEYRDLTGAGLQVLLVVEQNTTDAWGGYAKGVANAKAGLADARALGVPDSVGIAAAADAHAANQTQINAAVQYARGFQDVLGKARTGFYGFSETLTAVRNAGIGSWYWRCGSQPTAAERTWTHLWQRNAAPTVRVVSGVVCDINEQYKPISTSEDDVAGFDNDDAGVLMRYGVLKEGLNPNDKPTVENPGNYITVYNAFARIDTISSRVDAITASLAGLKTGGVDLDALAAKIAPLIPASPTAAEIAVAVLNEDHRRSEA